MRYSYHRRRCSLAAHRPPPNYGDTVLCCMPSTAEIPEKWGEWRAWGTSAGPADPAELPGRSRSMTGNGPCSSPPTSAVEKAPSGKQFVPESRVRMAGSALCAHLIHRHPGCQGAQPGTWTLPRSERLGPLRQAPLTILFVLGHGCTDPESRPRPTAQA